MFLKFYYCLREMYRRMINEKQTCPLRINQIGPWKREFNLDYWYKVGSDRICSFCGSIHPLDFEKIVNEILINEKFMITINDRRDKYYLSRPEIINATKGGIKFKKAHAVGEKYINRVNPILVEALKLSNQRWRKI